MSRPAPLRACGETPSPTAMVIPLDQLWTRIPSNGVRNY